MKSKATGCGSISTIFSSIILLCVSSTTTAIIIITTIIIITIIIIIIIKIIKMQIKPSETLHEKSTQRKHFIFLKQ